MKKEHVSGICFIFYVHNLSYNEFIRNEENVRSVQEKRGRDYENEKSFIGSIDSGYGSKLFDQNYALTAGGPAKKTSMLALDIYNTFYGRNGWEGVGQAKAVIFFILVGILALTQLYFTRRKEVES